MKKLFGVMVLAVVPVACGSGLPSGPDAAQPVDSGKDASVTSQRLVRTNPTPVPLPTCSTTTEANPAIVGINVSVVKDGPGFVIVRAEPVIVDADTQVACFAPVWTLGVKTKAHLEAGSDPQQTMLVGSAGEYAVTASVSVNGHLVSGTAVLTVQ